MDRLRLYSDEGRRTWAWAAVPLAWLCVFVAARGAGLLFGLAGLQPSGASGRWQDNIAGLFAWGVVLLILWAWLRWREGRSLRDIGLPSRWGRFGGGLALGLVMAVAAMAAGVMLGGFEIVHPGAWYDHLTPLWFLASTLTIAGTVMQAAAMEGLYRGWLMQAVARRWGVGLAIAANAVTSAYIAAGDVTRGPEVVVGAVNLALLAWLLSSLALRDGVLWGACGLHAGWNLALGLGFGLNLDGNHLNVTPMLLAMLPQLDAPWWLTGGDFGPDGSLVVTAVIGLGLLSRLMGRKTRRRRDDDDDEVLN